MKKLPNLQQKRKERGFTTNFMADNLKVSIHTYRSYEQGTRNPCLQTTINILKLLNCKMEELTKEK